jgi:hypothetical protein
MLRAWCFALNIDLDIRNLPAGPASPGRIFSLGGRLYRLSSHRFRLPTPPCLPRFAFSAELAQDDFRAFSQNQFAYDGGFVWVIFEAIKQALNEFRGTAG